MKLASKVREIRDKLGKVITAPPPPPLQSSIKLLGKNAARESGLAKKISCAMKGQKKNFLNIRTP